MDFRERALLGLPIETPFGELKPLSLLDYLERGDALAAITFDIRRVLHEIRLSQPDEKHRNSEEMTELLREMEKEYSIKQLLITYMEPYFHAYVDIISRCRVLEGQETFEEKQKETFEFLQDMEPKEFDALRKIILEINNQPEQTASLDPTVQQWKEKALRYKSSGSGDDSPNLSTMATSIVSFSGHTFEEVLSWNITQLHQVFQRIGFFKAYETTTLFATVTDKIDIQDWSKNIVIENDSNDSSSFAMSYDSLKSTMGDGVQQ